MTELSVYDAFTNVFPGYTSDRDEDMKWMPLDSGCGSDCHLAIKAAAQMVNHVRTAYGNDKQWMILELASITASVCGCYITG